MSTSVHNGTTAAAFSATALANALANDAGVALFVVDASLRIRHANKPASEQMSSRCKDHLGRPLSEVFPQPLASEYAAVAEQACSTDEPIDLIGMIDGAWRRLTFRPVHFEDNRCVLISSPPTAAFSPPKNGRRVLRSAQDDLGDLSKLTSRELEILRLVGLGLNTTQVAESLSRSVKTVDGHLLSIRNKIGQLTRTELAALAIESGLTRVDDEEVRRIARQARAAAAQS